MKRITLALFVMLLCTGCPPHNEQTPEQKLQQAQAQLVQQQATTSNWQLIAGVLAVGCIGLFFIGAMLGSKARKEAKREKTRR